jgi:hypothetical protein
MVARSSYIRVLDVPTYKELYERAKCNSQRHVIVKVDRTDTAAEAMPMFQSVVDHFRQGEPDFNGVAANEVLAITMMSVGIVVRRPDGKRATNRNVDIVWFPDVPSTTFFANEDVVAYVGEWPDSMCIHDHPDAKDMATTTATNAA